MKGNMTQTQSIKAKAIRRFSSGCLTKWNDLRDRVTKNLASEFAGVLNSTALRQVVNEADALAATTGFPALFLPTLAQEKAYRAVEWETRQRLIRSRAISFAE
jgi:hypothetical protein